MKIMARLIEQKQSQNSSDTSQITTWRIIKDQKKAASLCTFDTHFADFIIDFFASFLDENILNKYDTIE